MLGEYAPCREKLSDVVSGSDKAFDIHKLSSVRALTWVTSQLLHSDRPFFIPRASFRSDQQSQQSYPIPSVARHISPDRMQNCSSVDSADHFSENIETKRCYREFRPNRSLVHPAVAAGLSRLHAVIDFLICSSCRSLTAAQRPSSGRAVVSCWFIHE